MMVIVIPNSNESFKYTIVHKINIKTKVTSICLQSSFAVHIRAKENAVLQLEVLCVVQIRQPADGQAVHNQQSFGQDAESSNHCGYKMIYYYLVSILVVYSKKKM